MYDSVFPMKWLERIASPFKVSWAHLPLMSWKRLGCCLNPCDKSFETRSYMAHAWKVCRNILTLTLPTSKSQIGQYGLAETPRAFSEALSPRW